MADDPYAVLGVPKDASDEAIRRAFRDLAMKSHPDRNPGDKAAEERFKKISGAYDLLGDPDKRRRYDRGEIDARGEPRRGFAHPYGAAARHGGAGSGGGTRFEDYGFGDFFSDLFGEARRAGTGVGGRSHGARGRDIRYTLEVDFIEAVTGARKRVTLPDGGILDIQVPEGVADTQVLRLKGKGSPALSDGEAGDALVEIKVRPHAQFKRSGDDIEVDLPITIDEAVLGAKIEAPTVAGRVQLTIPKGTSSGRVLRLKGKGVRNMTTGETGDQLVTVRIVLPDAIDDGLSYFMSEWRQKNRYNPGRRG